MIRKSEKKREKERLYFAKLKYTKFGVDSEKAQCYYSRATKILFGGLRYEVYYAKSQRS